MGEDYPRTLRDREKRFPSEEGCCESLFALRWPQGFVCPRCGGRSAGAMGRGLWLCQGCRRQVSVTSGTIFQDRKLPLTSWLRALWYVTSEKNGVSALGLQRVLGVGSYMGFKSLPGAEGLSPPADRGEGSIGGRQHVAAPGASRGLPVEALAAGHASGCGGTRVPRLLPGRVHLPVQPPEVGVARQVVLPPGPTGCTDRPGPVWFLDPTTSPRGWLSQVDTHFSISLQVDSSTTRKMTGSSLQKTQPQASPKKSWIFIDTEGRISYQPFPALR